MLRGACLCFGLLQELQPNRILLITIHNPLYPITVDVLHQVFSPHGFVEKIVTFQKSAGLQALLQFQSQQSAMQARNTLQGRNIYDGCCTLDIQFSNLQELQVNLNNERTRDYTNANLPSEQSRQANPGNNNIMSSLFGEGGNHYNMLQPAGPRPGMPCSLPQPHNSNSFCCPQVKTSEVSVPNLF
jgi:hnRNP-L/PTB/hephaestus splicing factor